MRSVGADRRMTIETRTLGAGDDDDTKKKRDRDADERTNKLRDLLRRLNGSGRISVSRATHNSHDPQYLGSFKVTPEILESLEDFIIAEYGGGKYYVQIFDEGGDYIGNAPINIDLRQHPEKAPAHEAKAAAAPAAPVDAQAIAASTALAVTNALAPVLAKLADVQAAASQQKPIDPIAFATFMSAQQLQTIRAMQGVQAAQAGGVAVDGKTDFMQTFKEVAQMADLLGWQRGEKESLLEKIATAATPALINKFGPGIAAFLMEGANDEKKKTEAKEAPAPKPEAAAPARQPARGSAPLSPEKLAKYNADREAARKGKPIAAEGTPPPKAKEIAPDAVGEDKK